jgi:hypothetical protein
MAAAISSAVPSRRAGPAEHRPGEAEVFGEQVPGEQGEDAGVYADRDGPRRSAEPWLGKMPDGGERADAAEHTDRQHERGHDGDRDDGGSAPGLFVLVLGMMSCGTGHDTPV